MTESQKNAFQKALEQAHHRYNPKEHLLTAVPPKKNYHTKSGEQHDIVHNITVSSEYGVALVASGNPQWILRGSQVLERVIGLQDTSPQSDTYGVWPYNLEEPLGEMLSPDWNMANFNAKKWLHILFEYSDLLSNTLVEKVVAAIAHACESILLRDVGVDYTNINIMGACVTLLFGELMDFPRFFAYGKECLLSQVKFIKQNGNVTEYNSPIYGMLTLEEIGRILRYSKDEETIAAEYLAVRHEDTSFIVQGLGGEFSLQKTAGTYIEHQEESLVYPHKGGFTYSAR